MDTFQRHPVLYFADGNVCLSATHGLVAHVSSPTPSTEVNEVHVPAQPLEIVFRVHQSVLSLHSPIFKDLFALPSPPEVNETYDKAPLVRMPDRADDLESLLKAFYFGYELPFPRLDPRTPDAVRSILLMANKYQVDFVRRIIVTRLESDWPQTIEAWQRLEHEIEGMREDARGGVWNGTRGPSLELDNALPEPASAIRLARECNIPSILPPAFYHLSRLSIEDDWDLVRSYGPKKLTDVRKPQLSYGFRSARWSLLRAEDFRCLLVGKLAIEKHRACHSGLLPCRRSDGGDATDDWEECALEDEPENLKNFNDRIRDASTSDTDLLKVFGREQKYFMESWLFCWECREQIENQLNIWKKLPEYFALP